MDKLLANPVYYALCSGDRHLGRGTDHVRYFDEEVSPFVGIKEDYNKGFDELFEWFPAGRTILHATPQHIRIPGGWKLLQKVQGIQMIYTNPSEPVQPSLTPVPLQQEHIVQMMELAALTRPGPFGPRTIDFGHYHGIFKGKRLIAMTGQRLHVENFTEVSAVCTHPDHLGNGYAAALVQHQVHLIRSQQQTPFLHVRKDNERAIMLYKRLGFAFSGNMNFYFMERRTRRRIVKS